MLLGPDDAGGGEGGGDGGGVEGEGMDWSFDMGGSRKIMR